MNDVLAGWFGMNQHACFPFHRQFLDVQQARKVCLTRPAQYLLWSALQRTPTSSATSTL